MIKAWIKRNYYRLRYYGKNVKIESNVLLSIKDTFEGNNAIAADCELYRVNIGYGTYISENAVVKFTRIGRFCSIGRNLQTGLGTHPSKTFVSTHPAFFSTQKQAGFSFTDQDLFKEHLYTGPDEKYIVEIGNDVWIGNDVTIMDGIKIGDGAILAAGTIVTKDVMPYAIVAGVPAKVMRFRFTEQQIKQLLGIEWWNWDIEKIKRNSHLFNNIEAFIATVQ